LESQWQWAMTPQKSGSKYENSSFERKSRFNKRPVGAGKRAIQQSQDIPRSEFRTARPPRPRLAVTSPRWRRHRPYIEDDQQAATVEKSRRATIFAAFPATFAVLWSSGALIGPSEEAGMIALTLVRVIERHANELAAELVTKLAASPRTNDLHKVPVAELQRQIEEVLLHLSDWLLTKTAHDIERRYLELGERCASQGVALSDFCWAIAVTKEHLWEFVERQGFRRGPVEIYGEMELLRLLDQFFDRALCFATEGYEQYNHVQD
jgi:hypothetical protein